MEASANKNVTIEFSVDGFLLRPELWNEEVAIFIAGSVGMETMGEKHWAVIYFIREYWAKIKMPR